MTHSENSPQAQEVKAWAFWNKDSQNYESITFYEVVEAIEVLITPITNENQPPLAEKSLLNPNPLSGQSEGNREKSAKRLLTQLANRIAAIPDVHKTNKDHEALNAYEYYKSFSAMNSQGGAK